MNECLGSDIKMKSQDLSVQAVGEYGVAAGSSCLAQDLLDALMTEKGSLIWHPSYGVNIYKYIKMANTGVNRLQFTLDIKQTVEADPRVKTGSCIINILSWDLQQIKFKVTLVPIDAAHPLNLVLGYGAYGADGKVVSS